ncbi:MAG TPA: YdeI/OmpD-associated family protein [Cyclobacteriaceae bacterium]|nr:YdeI/OmpD-associated family protein [Cyclobacteriaceae bacterium]
MKKDKRIDAYIAKAQPFAKPILRHLRELVHQTCPDVTETIKWGFPHFDYKGMMCSMAAFKEHCAFGFWKAQLMSDPRLHEMAQSEAAMGHLGKIRTIKDLPSDKILAQYINEACRLNDDGIKVVKPKKLAVKKRLIVPADFKKALTSNKKVLAIFDAFSYSNKKDYLEWITEAKSSETRQRRLTAAIEWIAEGKIRNWKYAR